MVTKVHMEALSPTMEEGEVVRWLKDEGDSVDQGDVLAEIETDKATMELTARGAGVLRKKILSEGATAPVGTVIGVIADADEDIEGVLEDAGGEAPSGAAEAEGETSEVESEAGAEAEGEGEGEAAAEAASAPAAEPSPASDRPAAGAPARSERERIKASPLARRLAAEADLDLGRVQGSGPGGRIVKEDVETAIEQGVPERAAEAPKPAAAGGPRFAAPSYEGPEVEEVPVSQMRKTIAKRLTESLGPVPTFYLTVDVDMTRMMDARERMNRQQEPQGLKVSVNDLLIKATAAALNRHPEVNAAWHGDHIKRYHRVDIGVAVAVDEGLIPPVIRGADRKGAVRIGQEVRELAGRAREKKLQPEEYTGATFSISNLGMFGIEEFTAIINPPEAGILAVGKVEDRVVVEDGEPVIMPRMKITMSCDHRVVDGALGARFLQTLTGILEEPAMVLV